MDYTTEWVKAELLEGQEPEIPPIGQSVVLYLCPRDRSKLWESDIGSLYLEQGEADAIMWGSAFGFHSAFDGVKFEEILNDYEVCFTAVPTLEAGRFPVPLGISCERPKGPSRADIRRILDRVSLIPARKQKRRQRP